MANKLHKVLDRMVKQERWRKKPKHKGTLTKKEKTKTGGLKLTIGKRKVYVMKKNRNLFAQAEKAKPGDIISAAGRNWLGRFFVEKISVKKKEKEHQEKLKF